MNPTHSEFLTWNVLPARLNATQTAWLLGFECHEVTILAATGLLKPLGHPARNATKFFATATLEQLRRDEKWLLRATHAIAEHWRQQNARKRSACGRGETKLDETLRPVVPAAARIAAPRATGAPTGME